MHLKQKGYCLGVLLLFTITVTLPSVGWCEPAVAADGTSPKTSRGRPEETLELNMASTSAEKYFKPRGKPEETEGGGPRPSRPPPGEGGCGKGSVQHIVLGKFYITGQLEANTPRVDYQSDSAVPDWAPRGRERIRGEVVRGSEESWQRLQPVVECGHYAMTLTVRGRRAAQLLMDRVNESSVPLSQLPPQCGYSVQTTWRDFTLMAQYDACHITQQDDSYVLPLLWRGTPVKMSCPVSQIQPQAVGPSSLCCSLYGMTAKVQGLSAAEELRVNVRGEWIPLVVLTEQCGYTFDTQDAEIVITVPFLACGITVKDDKYTLSLQFKDKIFRLACPVSSPEELLLTHQPLVNGPHLTRVRTKHMEPVPWAPPFYLAPLYFPHPTYQHNYPSTKGHSAHSPPTPSSSNPDPTFGPQLRPPIDSQPEYQDYNSPQIPAREFHKPLNIHSSPSSMDDMDNSSGVFPDLQQKQETPVLDLLEKYSATHPSTSDLSFLTAASSLQLPSHAFNQYYHYYHHPKIPLPGPPQDPDPGPEVPKEQFLTNPHNLEFSALPPNAQQSDTLSSVNSDQFIQPVPEGHPYPHYPLQPYPYQYFYYFPHIARGEAKWLAPLNPDMNAQTNLSGYQNIESSTFVYPHADSSEVDNNHNLKPYTDLQKSDEIIHPNKHPLLFEHDHDDNSDIKAVLDDKKRDSAPVTPVGQLLLPPSYLPVQTSFLASSPNHNLPPYPHYYYHPYYHYYQMFYGPHGLLNTDNHAFSTSSKEDLDPLPQASSSAPQHPSQHKHQTTTPPTKSMYDVHSSLLRPYYHLYYQPKMSVENQELFLDHAGTMNSESDSDFSWMDWLVHPFSHFGHPGGEAEQRLDPYTPSASPCGVGPVSDFDCRSSLDCCSYPVKGCTVGEHLMFAVPDSVVQPTVAPLAHPSEVNVSCNLQRLTSDPNIYFVPLDGCGVNKHVLGQTVIHRLEIHGFHSLQEDSSVHLSSPVRLMVECSSSQGSPGEVRLLVMDQPPPPHVYSTPVTVQLRIATDDSFTSFYPEAHLPLSFMRGRLVYVEVSLLDPPEPGLMLLVHSCLAYTQTPYTSWMLVYDGPFTTVCTSSCPCRGYSQLLPVSNSDPHHIRRILVSSFLSLPSEGPSFMAKGGYSHLQDPEVCFWCLTDVCSATDGGCTVGCINSKSSQMEELSSSLLG